MTTLRPHDIVVEINGETIPAYTIATWKAALKLEALGMKRRGQSVNTIACSYLGLPKGTKIAHTLAVVTDILEQVHQTIAEHAIS